MASHLPRLKDLDGLDTRFLAPAARFALGQRTASHPFGVAAGRDALGPEVARRVRGEMDHETVRIDMARAAALVHLATGIGGLELDAHDYSVMKWPVAPSRWPTLGQRTKLRRAAGRFFHTCRLASSQGLVTLSQMFARRSQNGSFAPAGGQK